MVTRTAYGDVATSIGVTLDINTRPSSTQMTDWITDIYIDLYDRAKITYAADDTTDTELIINSEWGAKFVKQVASRMYYEWQDPEKRKNFTATLTEDEITEFKEHMNRDDDRPLIRPIDIFQDTLDM